LSELPRMYHNKIDNDLNNNERVFSTLDSNNIHTNSFINNKNNLTVEQKIVNIFNSPNYIYKIDVVIVTDNNKVIKRIIGKNKNNLITMDNEYIPINTIRDIYINK
jgi:hypothetical protein